MTTEGVETEIAPEYQGHWQTLVQAARQKIVDQGWPIPKKPAAPLNTLEIPNDIETLSSVQLANLMIRLGAWYSYGTAQLSFANAELAAAEEYFALQLGERMYAVSDALDKREVKEILRAKAITGSVNLRKFMDICTQLDQRARAVQGLVTGLEIQCRMLQSEQIRRASENKLTSKGDF